MSKTQIVTVIMVVVLGLCVARAGAGGDPLEAFDLTGLSVARQEILSGGPGKDGIPALVKPKSVPVSEARFLDDQARVVGVTVNGWSRGYPINVLNWHEAINDELGGVPIAVIYCPLCDSVSVVDRRIDEEVLTFGISGLLYNSNVLLYDKADDSLWSQVGLRAISGPNVGRSLKHRPWEVTRFGAWRGEHPNATVVTLETGYRRDYQHNPYAGYFADQKLMFPVRHFDGRLHPKARVVGVKIGDAVCAYPVNQVVLAPGGRVEDRLGSGRVVLQADDKTGGIGVIEVPANAQVVHTFWFAWAGFHPNTDIYLGRPTGSGQQADR